MTGGPVRTVFFGSGGFAVPILEAVAAAPEVDLIAVVSAPDRPVGRGHRSAPTAVAALAAQLGLTVLRPTGIRSAETIAEIADLRPAFGVLADYGRIVPPAILDIPDHGILNVHPSLLPRHRGATPIPATILAGDPTTGVTIIRMDAGLDTGPIVASQEWPLDANATAPAVESQAAEAGARLLSSILPAWLDGSLVARGQDEAAATLTRPLRRDDGLLDPHRPAADLARQVRAYQPWPGSYLETADGRLTVWRATVGVAGEPRGIGTLAVDAGLPVLPTVDGWLRLDEVQPAGGRRMAGEEYLRGRGRELPRLPVG